MQRQQLMMIKYIGREGRKKLASSNKLSKNVQIRFFPLLLSPYERFVGHGDGSLHTRLAQLFEIQSIAPRLSYATIIRTSFQSNCSPSFSNLIIYLYFSSLLRFFVSKQALVIDVNPFCAPFCMSNTKKEDLCHENSKFLFRAREFFVRLIFPPCVSPRVVISK